MFKNTQGKVIQQKRRDANSEINDTDLWELPRQEYLQYHYPKLILEIIKKNKTIKYEKIKYILHMKGYPTDLGYVFAGLNELKKESLIIESPRHTYTIASV